MADELQLFILNDHVVRLRGLRNGQTGAYINNAVVEATIIDARRRDPIGGIEWPLSLAYVAASDGVYEGLLDEEFEVMDSGRYRCLVDATSAPDVKGHWNVPVRAREREE